MIAGILSGFIFFCYIVWLILCLPIALIYWLFPHQDQIIDNEKLRKVSTICGLLFEKQKLSENEYKFEFEVVASNYSEFTFTGYRLLVAPVVWLVQAWEVTDPLVLFFTRRWIALQKHILQSGDRPGWLDRLLGRIAIGYAYAVGRTLHGLARNQ